MNNKKRITEISIALFLIIFGIVLRFLPHAPNFAPIAALALFGGVYLPKKLAIAVPLTAMLISDMFIGFYSFPIMLAVYFCFLLFGLFGLWLKKNKKWYNIGGFAIVSAVLFFFITNFAVWVFTPWYAKTISGLIQCFVMALPFFRNTLFSNLFYSICFFSVYELASLLVNQKYEKYNENHWLAKIYSR